MQSLRRVRCDAEVSPYSHRGALQPRDAADIRGLGARALVAAAARRLPV